MCNCPQLAFCFCAKTNVCVDHTIGAPGHGKYLVDGLNACDKKHLKWYMKHINQPHEGDGDININPYLIYKKQSHLLMNVEDIVWKDENLDQKVVANTKKVGKCNNQEKALSCDRCWWQNSPPQFDFPTYFVKTYKKQYDSFRYYWELPHPLWSIPWSWLSICKNNSMLLLDMHKDNKNWIGRRERTRITSSPPEECTLQVRISLIWGLGI